MKALRVLFILLAILPLSAFSQPVSDIDGHQYDTVRIGTQTWFKQNLRVTRFNDGTPIPWVADSLAWSALTTAGRCYYNNDSTANDSVYGPLYNWYALTSTLCPVGWHVATDLDWTTLENYLGGDAVAGGKMKEAGTAHWLSPNTDATNSSGFSGLPGGMRGMTHVFQYKGENGLWWTSTSQNVTSAWSRYLWYMYGGIDRNPTPKKLGMSVRCIQDPGAGLGRNEVDGGIRVFPNPASTNIMITGGWQAGKDVSAMLLSPMGRVVWESGPGTVETIPVESYPDGIYLLVLRSGNSQATSKVVINH